MSHVFPRHAESAPPVAAGCHLIDSPGKRCPDGSGVAAISLLRAAIVACEAADAEHDQGVREVLEAAGELASEIVDDCERLEGSPNRIA